MTALHLVGCAAPPVLEIQVMVTAAQAHGWDTWLVLSPTAADWLESAIPALTEQTGHPVCSRYPRPGEPGGLPPATAVLVAPATANTISKLAAGICDTLALGVVNRAIARRLPVTLLPCLNGDETHPAYPRNVATLREAGVRVLDNGAGRQAGQFAWWDGLAALHPPGRSVKLQTTWSRSTTTSTTLRDGSEDV